MLRASAVNGMPWSTFSFGPRSGPIVRSTWSELRDHFPKRLNDVLFDGLGLPANVAVFQEALDALHILAEFPEFFRESDHVCHRLQHVDGFGRLLFVGG